MEDVLIPVVIFSSLLLFVKMILDYARFKHENKHQSGGKLKSGEGASLRVSELEDLIQHAVDDAVRPLERRLRRIERASTARAAATGESATEPAGKPPTPLLDDIDEPDLDDGVYESGASRPRVRRH